MHITRQMLEPSREDAVRLTREEKLAMLWLANADATLEEVQTSMADRLTMLPDGPERMKKLAQEADDLLAEIRLTIPINQRMNLENTRNDFEVRLTPKMTPMVTNVIMTKDEFKQLIDVAREKCHDCTEDDVSCEKCRLFTLLTSILPLDDYHDRLLCPYNLGEWGN